MATIDYKQKIKDYMNSSEVDTLYKSMLNNLFPELTESEDEKVKKAIISIVTFSPEAMFDRVLVSREDAIAWLEKQGEKSTLPKWKYKKDNTPLLRDSLILNKYGCVAKSPSGALVSDVWVIDYAELAKLPKEVEKQGEQKPADKVERKGMNIVEEDMTPFQKKVFCIIDTTIEEEQGLKQVCDELLRLAHDEIMQESAWREEDETGLTNTIIMLKEGASLHFNKKDITKAVDWLKSLKDRIQPKQEWSENDKEIIEALISLCDETQDKISQLSALKSWLKSLRPQSTWKPSDEQMDALQYVYRNLNPPLSDKLGWNSLKTLELMYQDLKKLREG